MTSHKSIMVWGDYGPDSVTGRWSANTYDAEDAVEYVPADLAQAAVDAALEGAAVALNDRGAREEDNFGLNRASQNYFRARDMVRALITAPQRDALQAVIDAAVAEARAEDAAALAESRAYGLAMQEELRVRTAKLERECKLTQAQVDRMLVSSTQTHAKLDTLAEAAQALGAMPEGYCFCGKDRIGDDSKIHEPECRDLRAALAQIGAKP